MCVIQLKLLKRKSWFMQYLVFGLLFLIRSLSNKAKKGEKCSEKYKNYMPLGFCNDEVLHVCTRMNTGVDYKVSVTSD